MRNTKTKKSIGIVVAVAALVLAGCPDPPSTVTVPNAVGLTHAAATTVITGAGLTLGVVSQAFHATVPTGQVISQDPVAGADAARDSAVALVVSKGPDPADGDIGNLKITEIMYHSLNEVTDYLEFQNVGTDPIDVSGIYFSEGIGYTFPQGTVLEPGAYYVIAAFQADFTALYPGVQLAATYANVLSNAGEELVVCGPDDAELITLTYDDKSPWPPAADGQGFSMVIIDLNGDPGDPGNWRASGAVNGSPGEADQAVAIPGVLVNEALTHTDLPLVDAIELYNPTGSAVDVRGWYLTDDRTNPARARIPDEPQFVLAAGAYVVIYEFDFKGNPGSVGSTPLPGFGLSEHGDEEAYLYSADQDGNLTGYGHGFDIEPAENGVAFGRHVSSEGRAHFVAQSQNSLGAANAGPQIGPVVISEIYYNPSAKSVDVEYVKLENISQEAVNLWDDAPGGNPDNAWEIDGIGFVFPQRVTMAAGSSLIVADADPGAFRAQHSIPAAVGVYGPFGLDAALNNAGEPITIHWPDIPDPEGVDLVAMDRVTYDDLSPWPDADGNGLALIRLDLEAFGDDPVNWEAAAPSITGLGPKRAGEGKGGDGSERAVSSGAVPDLFDTSRVLEVNLSLCADDWDALSHQAPANTYICVRADVTIGGVLIGNVGLRKRGSAHSCESATPSLEIGFDRYVDGVEVQGYTRMLLNNSVGGSSLVRQGLALEVFAAAGVPVPRWSFVHVTVNGNALGVYVNVEPVDTQFIRSRFLEAEGALYRAKERDCERDWTEGFQRVDNSDIPESGRMAGMVAALQANDDEVLSALALVLDVDAFLTFWATEVLTGHFDGYALSGTNCFVYDDPASERCYFIPGDMGLALSDPEAQGWGSLEELGASHSVYAGAGVPRRLYGLPEMRGQYVARLEELLDTVWVEEELLALVDELEGLLAQYPGALDGAAVNDVRDSISNQRAVITADLDAGAVCGEGS